MKEILFKKDGFDSVMNGFNKTADAICSTLGPAGGNVFADDPIQPEMTNDGKKVGESISFPNKFENAGAWVVKNTCSQTDDEVHDATTTTACLLKAIVHESLKRPENPVFIKSSLKDSSLGIIEAIKASSIPVTLEDTYKVALTSSEDPEIATLVSDMIKKLGAKASITVEQSITSETTSEVVNGYEANVGFMSTDFINNKEEAKAIYEDVPILVSRTKFSNVMDIKTLFDGMQTQKIGKIVIVCEEMAESILGLMSINNKIGNLNILVIKATGTILEDIAAITGATIISETTGVTFATLKVPEHLGTAQKIICGEKKTVFMADKGKEYIARLEVLAESIPNQFEQKKIQERIAKLSGGVGVIRIGANTDLDRGYKKDKCDDTIGAVKSALEEGVVEGGGMTLWRIAHALESKTVGEEIIKKALSAPLRTILENAGKDYTEIITKMPQGMGYDAKNDTYTNLIENGIVDPAKSERVALKNAISNASMFITSSAFIVDAKIEK
jgi:chaperonin GroEL